MPARMSLVSLFVLMLLATSVAASAQSNVSTGRIQETRTITAEVEINLNGETFLIQVPAEVTIDHQFDLSQETAVASVTQRVGVLNWYIVTIEEHEEFYVHGPYREVEVSTPNNKLVVVKSEITNLDNEPFSTFDFDELLGVDETGKTYEYSERFCDDVNPGATDDCTLVFDVADNVSIVGLDLKVVDHRRLMYEPTDTE